MKMPLFLDLYFANQTEKKGSRKEERNEERKE